MLSRVLATRYLTPLREGGSLPGIIEADDLGTYVLKFTGAGQGVQVLVSEVVVAGIARHIGLRVPDLRAVELSPAIARYEADEEVQDLLNASIGLNLGIDFLPGSFAFDTKKSISADLGARILWLDALTANVDRTWRNPNLLVWHGELWCIDHGAALYFHYGWNRGTPDPAKFAAQPFDASNHVMLRFAGRASELDTELSASITRELLEQILTDVPDEWLELETSLPTKDDVRSAYVEFLLARVAAPRRWLPGV